MFRFTRKTRQAIEVKAPEGLTIDDIVLPWSEVQRHILLTGKPGSGKSWLLLRIIRELVRLRIPLFVTTTKVSDFFDILAICRDEHALDRLVRLGLPMEGRLEPATLNVGKFFASTLPGGSPRVLAYHLRLASEVMNNSSSHGGARDEFFKALEEEAGIVAASAVSIGTGNASLDIISDFIMSLPGTREQVQSDDFYTATTCGRVLELVKKNHRPEEKRTYKQIVEFCTGKICTIGEKARGAAVQGAGAVLSGLVSDPFYGQVCTETTWTPQRAEAERLITVCDGMPHVLFSTGRAFNFLHMAAVQAWILARDPGSVQVPMVAIRDEAGEILTRGHDQRILAGCRALKLACIDAVQTLPLLQSALSSEEEMKAFLGLHARVIAFSNACNDTNKYMSEMIGDEPKILTGGSTGENPNAGLEERAFGATASFNWHQQMLPKVPPHVFGQLGVGQAILVADGDYRFLNFREGGKR